MEKKNLLHDNEIIELTLDECFTVYKPTLIKLAYSYHNLKIEFDDRFQIASMGLTKAYKTYNNTKYPFVAYLKIVINNEFKQVFRKQNKEKDIKLVSTDNHIPDNYDILLGDTIEDKKDIFNLLETKDIINNIFYKMSDIDRKIVKLRLEGYKKPKISKIVKLSIPQINYRLLKFKNELLKEVRL